MFNIFERITRKKTDAILFEMGVIGESGRLTEQGARAFVDLLFIGKTPEEARSLIVKECEKTASEK